MRETSNGSTKPKAFAAASPELLPTQPDSSEESPLELLLHCAEEVVHCGKCEDCKKMAQTAIQQARKETRNE